jgi:dimethylaniline monooxygenase (N-oxide forming)
VDPDTNRVELFRQMLAPDLPDTLAFVGVIQPQSGFMPVIEMQARWITALWQGRITLPSKARMLQEIAADRREREANYVIRPRHSVEVESPGYADRLARQLGVMPKPLQHLPVLRELLFEPIHAAQYRLDGPGAKPTLAEQTLLNLARNRRTECFNKMPIQK